MRFFAWNDDDEAAELMPGRGFATKLTETVEGKEETCEVYHSANWAEAYNADDFARFGIHALEVTPPEGKVLAYYALYFDGDGRLAITAAWDDLPPPPRLLLPKSQVQERVNTLGKLGDVLAILNSDPILFGRWFAPNWPNVYADDEGLIQVLTAVGLNADEIAWVTG